MPSGRRCACIRGYITRLVARRGRAPCACNRETGRHGLIPPRLRGGQGGVFLGLLRSRTPPDLAIARPPPRGRGKPPRARAPNPYRCRRREVGAVFAAVAVSLS